MKKLESTWYNMACVLTGISLVAGVALASVNKMTKDTIQELNDMREQAAIAQVLGGGDVKIEKVDTVVVSDNNYIVMNAGQKGVAIKAVDPLNASFGGDLVIMVGISSAGDVLGYNVLETHETPGLGAKAGEWFQDKILSMNPGKNNFTVSKDGGEVDAITASTITSRAFLRAVNTAYKAYCQTQQDSIETDGVSGATQQHHN